MTHREACPHASPTAPPARVTRRPVWAPGWCTLTASSRRSSSICERWMTRTCGRSGRRPRRIWSRSSGSSRRSRRSWDASRRARVLGQQPRESRPPSVQVRCRPRGCVSCQRQPRPCSPASPLQAPAAGTTSSDTPITERLWSHLSMTRMCGRRPRHSLNLADPLLVAARPAPATLQDGVAHRRLRSLVLQSPPPPLPARRRRARALQQLRHR